MALRWPTEWRIAYPLWWVIWLIYSSNRGDYVGASADDLGNDERNWNFRVSNKVKSAKVSSLVELSDEEMNDVFSSNEVDSDSEEEPMDVTSDDFSGSPWEYGSSNNSELSD